MIRMFYKFHRPAILDGFLEEFVGKKEDEDSDKDVVQTLDVVDSEELLQQWRPCHKYSPWQLTSRLLWAGMVKYSQIKFQMKIENGRKKKSQMSFHFELSVLNTGSLYYETQAEIYTVL